jgi:hypothetical protein
VLDIIVHRDVLQSKVIVSDILDSDNLPNIFHVLDHDTTRNLSDLIGKFTIWEQFQSLASELISPKIKINSGKEVDKVT